MTPAYLYHGTTERHLSRILADGIKPRGEHGRSNWKRTIESNAGAVYLTDAYPLYFASNAARTNERLAVIQLETEALDNGNLVPDEDVLEQSGRRHDDVPGTMKQRTRHYRARLPEFRFTDNWQASLRGMGTCCYLGTIAPAAITRVALVNLDEAPTLALASIDPSICLSNYRFCAARYRNLTNRLFGLPVEPDPLEPTISEAALAEADAPEMEAIRAIARGRQEYRKRLEAEYAAAVEILEFNPKGNADAA